MVHKVNDFIFAFVGEDIILPKNYRLKLTSVYVVSELTKKSVPTVSKIDDKIIKFQLYRPLYRNHFDCFSLFLIAINLSSFSKGLKTSVRSSK